MCFCRGEKEWLCSHAGDLVVQEGNKPLNRVNDAGVVVS